MAKIYRVKPVLTGHLWVKKKWPKANKTGDLLKEVQFI